MVTSPRLLAVQDALRGGRSFDDLVKQFALRVAYHPELPLVILNYDQCESRPKSHPVVRESRGLVLERNTWNVVARAFPRFFAWGETPDCDKEFDWRDSHVQEKHDGSLVLVYRYGGRLFVNTRGSFGTGPIQRGWLTTWEEVFFTAFGTRDARETRARVDAALPDGHTAVFELCSPYNRIVRKYAFPTAYLLSVFHTATGAELPPDHCDDIAGLMGGERPATVEVGSLAELRKVIAANPNPTFEGYVARDRNGRRKKVKSGRYEALHRVKCGVEPALSPKTFAPFLVAGDGSAPAELLDLLNEAERGHYFAARGIRDAILADMNTMWNLFDSKPDQKGFAMAVMGSPSRAMLFEARKRKCHPREVWAERAEDFLADYLDDPEMVPTGPTRRTSDDTPAEVAV